MNYKWNSKAEKFIAGEVDEIKCGDVVTFGREDRCSLEVMRNSLNMDSFLVKISDGEVPEAYEGEKEVSVLFNPKEIIALNLMLSKIAERVKA